MSTPTPASRPAHRLLLRQRSNLSTRSFPPTYNNLPAITASDPFGLLPYNRTIRNTKACILHLSGGQLRPFEWPVENGARVPPSEFDEYRRTHKFTFPCCLCALHDPTNTITESAVFLVTSGTLAGQYVAACANGVCKYWIFLERFFPKRGVPIRMVRKPPPTLFTMGKNLKPLQTHQLPAPPDALERTLLTEAAPYVLTNVAALRILVPVSPINPFIVPYATPEPRPVPESPFAMLMQLDASSNPGLTETQFRRLFVRCSDCKLYTTTSAFEDHNCRPYSPAPAEIIDLTGDD
ncbi:hypothetical protein B0H11DRAFT_2359297 [Mycena galericulata]|nr:hypothetical protein B0H11DRAFT_2359297 [Mycena galericulata]